MALTTIQSGAVAKSSVLNDNFIYLDEKISSFATNTSNKVDALSNSISVTAQGLSTANSSISELTSDISNVETTLQENINAVQTAVDAVCSNIAPNYKAGYSISNGFTAPKLGWCYFGGQADGNSSVNIDGVYFEVSWDSGDGQSRGELFVFVDKGTVVNGFSRIREARFFPCKGAK